MNSNQDLKAYAKHKGVFLWELAEYLSIIPQKRQKKSHHGLAHRNGN